MKSPRTLAVLFALAAAGAAVQLAAKPFVVHEWGTFTSVSGSDGKLLPGLEVEESALPPFVHSHAGFFPANKGWNRPVADVTIKMETPVLYFYSDAPRTVNVDVKFNGGSISQWYPERLGGEALPQADENKLAAMLEQEKRKDSTISFEKLVAKVVPPVKFSPSYAGAASWSVEVLAPGAPDRIWSQQPWDTPEFEKAQPAFEHWARARVAGANKVRGPGRFREVEGFIFYRGIGNFGLPLRVASSGGSLQLDNAGADSIPFLFVYEKRAAFPQGVVWWSGSLAGGGRKSVPLLKSSGDIAAEPVLRETFPRALERAGLTAEEARALVATWKENYFDRDGVRVFWIVPRAFTDSVLPISIAPKPDRLERVLVGRSEVLTPQFETELKNDFAADRGKRWMADRYYRAYLARVQQLGVVLADARP